MKNKAINSKAHNYYSGGLAEIVSNPTLLTYSFFKDWFTGEKSIGKAMQLLNIPYEKITLPILELVDKELLINLTNEEETLYKHTIFTYRTNTDMNAKPKLVVAIKKIFNPRCIKQTLGLLMKQSQWIAQPEAVVKTAQKLLKTIPTAPTDIKIHSLDEIIGKQVFPQVIAIGLLTEFYNQLIEKESKENIADINHHISTELVHTDWFFTAFSDQELVKDKTLSFDEYLKKYGIRADNDYELTEPRWYEIPEEIKKRINEYSPKKKSAIKQKDDIPTRLKKVAGTAMQLQLLRSEAKRKALVFINLLRKELLMYTKDMGNIDIENLTREDILTNSINLKTKRKKTYKKETHSHTNIVLSSGQGIGVSRGEVTGRAKRIFDVHTKIPNKTIGIFPSSSPKLAIQYPKCAGMIFLKGGQTSHGAIVAREYGIPALTDANATNIKEGIEMQINGLTGGWNVL
jgi:phosphohistidine swiveling domain-containing protein